MTFLVVMDYNKLFLDRYQGDFKTASIELGKSERTLKRYLHSGEVDQTVLNLLCHLENVPIHPKWNDCYFTPEGHLKTPYGLTKVSDIMLVHKYKWHSESASHSIKKLKNTINTLNNEKEPYFEKLETSLLETLGLLAQRNA